MTVIEIRKTIVDFSENEREILSKAEEILSKLSLEADKVDALPMSKEEFDLLNNIWEYSSEVRDKIVWD